MTRHRSLSTVVTLLLLGAAVGVVGQTPGLGAASFLRRGVDARALAMGGAHVAVADGSSAMYWNPAGLARVPAIEVGGMTTDIHAAAIFLNFVAGVVPLQLGPKASPSAEPPPEEALSFVGRNAQASPPTDAAYQNAAGRTGGLEFISEGRDDRAADTHTATAARRSCLAVGLSWTEMATEVRAYDNRGNTLGLIRYSESLYALGVATWVPNLGYAGGVVKAYRFSAPRAGVGGADATAFGIGFDAGIAVPVWQGLWLGIAAADIANSRVQWRNTPLEPTDLVSARYTAGTAYFAHGLLLEDDRLTVALDATFEPSVGARTLKAGAEYGFLFLALRAGTTLRSELPPSFSAGIGVRAMGFAIDGAWVQNRELEVEGAGHTLSVSATFRF